jgi:hypothetical protein
MGDFRRFPAPAAAVAAMDGFCEALQKIPHCYHVFAVTLLMTNRWRKTLLKAIDVYFLLKPVCALWDHSQHEPLGIFISLPLSRHEPWRLRNTQPVVDLLCALREVPDDDFVQKVINYSHSRNPPCAPARTHGQIQAPREPPN